MCGWDPFPYVYFQKLTQLTSVMSGIAGYRSKQSWCHDDVIDLERPYNVAVILPFLVELGGRSLLQQSLKVVLSARTHLLACSSVSISFATADLAVRAELDSASESCSHWLSFLHREDSSSRSAVSASLVEESTCALKGNDGKGNDGGEDLAPGTLLASKMLQVVGFESWSTDVDLLLSCS